MNNLPIIDVKIISRDDDLRIYWYSVEWTLDNKSGRFKGAFDISVDINAAETVQYLQHRASDIARLT